MTPRKIYVASSWRNSAQPDIVKRLREFGHEVYDFRHPEPGDNGFHWSEIDAEYDGWSRFEFIEGLTHSLAESGFNKDFAAMQWADTFLLVLPCGKSAHLELGWACGAGKETYILLDEQYQPELMYKMVDRLLENIIDFEEVFDIRGH